MAPDAIHLGSRQGCDFGRPQWPVLPRLWGLAMRGNEARLIGQDFENEVRRIARLLWPAAEFAGAAMVDGREFDGIFDTEDCRHIVEATTSRRKDKAEDDLKKLAQLVRRHGSRTATRAVRGWFVTAEEPTADQRQVANKYRDVIYTLSFAQFQSRLMDSRGYLNLRDKCAFGSVRDLTVKSRGGELDPAAGWDILLDRVSDREARIEAGIDGRTVRRILERLATKARDSQGGLGPLRQESVVEAFRDICGYGPDDHGMVLLQRLPGLGVYHDEAESRIFVDEAFVDACRGGDVAAFVDSPFDFDSNIVSRIESAMGGLGVAIANQKLEKRGSLEGKISTAIGLAQQQNCPNLVVDLARIILLAGLGVRTRVVIAGVVVQELELGSPSGDVSPLEFSDCFFGRVELEPQADVAKLPTFRGCYIQSFEGRVSIRDVPADKFDPDCIIDGFIEAAGTTAAVLTLDLPLGTRVCLTVLKKIYERRGSGRKENALYRGLDQRARKVVPGVLQALKSEGLALPYRRRTETIWLPSRDRRRAGRLIAAPSEEMDDPVLMRCAGLSG